MIKLFSILFIILVCNTFTYAISLKQTIQMTLENDSTINIKKEDISNYEGLYLQSKQEFDTNFNLTSSIQRDKSAESVYLNNNTTNNDTASYDASLSKYLESGYTFTSGITYDESKLTYNSSNTDYKYNQSGIYFSINKALLKDSSQEVITSDKQQSKYNLKISTYSYKYQLNTSLYNTINSYWEFLYAYEKSKLDFESKQRAQRLIENTNELIIADSKPRADILQPKANLNSKVLTLLNTEQLVNDKRYEMGTKIGYNLQKSLSIDMPIDDFPKPGMNNLENIADNYHFINLAIEQRIDLKLLDLNIKKAKLDILVAKDSFKSDLDLTLSASYNGTSRDEDITSSFDNYNSNKIEGNSVKLALEYKFPIENSYAKGLYLSNKSKLSQSIINYDELKRNISYEVNKLLDQIKITILSYKEIENSVIDYAAALENEKIKYTMGFSTILNIIQTEDSLYAEKIKRLSILKTYALQIAKLHYTTSNIVNNDENLNINHTKFFVIKWNENAK